MKLHYPGLCLLKYQISAFKSIIRLVSVFILKEPLSFQCLPFYSLSTCCYFCESCSGRANTVPRLPEDLLKVLSSHLVLGFGIYKTRLFAQLCPTLCNPVDCSPPGSSVHGILQARVLEWVAISFSRGSS